MGFLKGLGTTICSILLFLGLSVFSVAFLLNGTILNADFVHTQLDKIDVSSIAEETINKQIDQAIPADAAFLKDVAYKILDTEEPLIKAQIHDGIDSAYSYFLKEEGVFSVTFSLVEIKQSLKDSLWQTAVDYLKEQLSGVSDAEVNRYVEDIMTQIPEESLPSSIAVLPESLRHEVIKQYLKELGGRGIFEGTSFGLDTLVEGQVRAYFEQYFDDTINQIQDSYVIDESTIGPDAVKTFHDVQKVIGYFQAAYVWLIVFMVVMAGLIFLINWSNVRTSTRALGIDLLIFGILDLASVLIPRYYQIPPANPVFADIPLSLRSWVQGLIHDVTGVMLPFSIGVLVVGVIFVVVSIVIKPREANSL